MTMHVVSVVRKRGKGCFRKVLRQFLVETGCAVTAHKAISLLNDQEVELGNSPILPEGTILIADAAPWKKIPGPGAYGTLRYMDIGK